MVDGTTISCTTISCTYKIMVDGTTISPGVPLSVFRSVALADKHDRKC